MIILAVSIRLRRCLSFCLLLAVLAGAPASAALAAPKPVTVTRMTWHGWPGSLRVSNGLVEAIVVPTIGRIMAFQFTGQPETSPIFQNKDWTGKTIADTDPTNWAAFGGDKLWPSPQSDWPKHNVRGWPPDQTFDGDPEAAQVLPNGVRLTTPDSVAFAARSTRTITLRPGEARLYIAQTLIKDTDAQNPPSGNTGLDTPTLNAPATSIGLETQNAAARQQRDAFPIGIWSITQTRGDETVFLPLSKSGRFPLGYTSLGATGDVLSVPHFTTSSGLLHITRDLKKSHKIGMDSPAGWIAALYGGTILFSEHYPYQSSATYPDGGVQAEVYTNAGATAYIEMELLGPLVALTHGNKISHNIFWQLQRLPHTPKSVVEAGALVKAAMR